jgi:hypothetical protein
LLSFFSPKFAKLGIYFLLRYILAKLGQGASKKRSATKFSFAEFVGRIENEFQTPDIRSQRTEDGRQTMDEIPKTKKGRKRQARGLLLRNKLLIEETVGCLSPVGKRRRPCPRQSIKFRFNRDLTQEEGPRNLRQVILKQAAGNKRGQEDQCEYECFNFHKQPPSNIYNIGPSMRISLIELKEGGRNFV